MANMKLSPAFAALALVGAMGLGGCASSLTGGAYDRTEARGAMAVRFGEVTTVRPVLVEGTKSGVGTVSGAAIGGIAGSTLGGGRGAAISTVIGAVAGGIAGSAIESGSTKKPGIEVTVRLDNGQYLAVVQEDGGEEVRAGERVRILDGSGNTRVAR